MKLQYLLLLTLLNPVFFLHALTVGVFDIKGDVGDNGARLADQAHSEIQSEKSITMRERRAIENAKTEQEKCALGVKKCDIMSGDLKTLDVYITGEAVTLAGTKQIILKAVKTGDQSVAALSVGSADSLEKSMEHAAADLRKKLAGVTKKDAGATGRWKLAINPVKAGNQAAERLNELRSLDSMLMHALSKRAAFDLVDTKNGDIISAEYMASVQGFAPAASAPIAGDYTHFVEATIKAYDDARVLSYHVINKKTRTAVISDIIEWTVGQNPDKVFDDIAEKTETDVMKVLGKVEILACDPADAKVIFEFKDPSQVRREQICKSPLLIEDIPAGDYTVYFTHEERNTLTQAITVKPVETLKLGKIVLPDIDMTLFQQASSAEGAGKYAEANSLYSQFYTKYPRHRMASYAMYREGYVTQLRLKKVADGRKILESVISRQPDAEIRSEAYVGKALGYKAEGDAEKANEIFRMLTDQYAGTTAAEFARECLEGKCSF